MKLFSVTTRTGTHTAFSLVEFVVIISIFAVMAGIALFNYGSFNSTVSLNNLAHDIALTIRQTQVYGISATEGVGTTTQIRGVYFPFTSGAFSSSFTIFIDADATGTNPTVQYSVPPDVDIDTVSIATSDRIADIQTGSTMTSLASCTTGVVIAFKRPDPDPLIFCGQTPAQFARITVIAANSSRTQHVEVWPTGQITITP